MGGKRSTLLRREVDQVLGHYDIGAVTEVRAFERGSHESPKAVIRTDRGRFLLKRRPDRDDPMRVAFAHSLQIHLLKNHFPLPRLMSTTDDGLSMFTYDDAIYEVYEFIKGDRYDKSIDATFSAGRTLGLYHKLVVDFESPWDPPPGHYHNSEMVHEAITSIRRLLLKDKPPDASAFEKTPQILSRAEAQYRAAAAAAEELGVSRWQRQIVHSDWHPGNLVFEGHDVCAVLDFDSARIRPRVMDVANGCLQFSMITGGRDLTTWQNEVDMDRLVAVLKGYEEVIVLTKAELNAIPHLMIEAIIAQALRPIMRSGTIAGLDGTSFLAVVGRKARWIGENLSGGKIETAIHPKPKHDKDDDLATS